MGLNARSHKCAFWGVATAGLMALAPLSHAADEPVFQSISQQRSVQISGEIGVYGMFGEDNIVDSFTDRLEAVDFGPAALQVGMALRLPDGGDYFGAGDGQARQTTSLGPEEISFSGLADVNMSGYAGYPYTLDGSGGARVEMVYEFSVGSERDFLLSMSSEIGQWRDEDFGFSLVQVASGGETSIWTQTAIVDDDGTESRSFSQQLTLGAGQYRLSTHLNAFSHVNGVTFSGRTRAEFTLAALPPINPVPEPGTWAMALAGLGLVAAARARTKAAQRRTRLAHWAH